MANHPSAQKRNRQNIKRRLMNRSTKSELRTTARDLRAAVATGDLVKAKELLKAAERGLSKAATKGVIHPRNAGRSISRLAKLVSSNATAK